MVKIYCPKCKWKPNPHSLWCCDPGCQHVWNTFDTYGRCPGCGFIWRETACHDCGAWSPHHDWYHDDTDIDAMIEMIMEQETFLVKKHH